MASKLRANPLQTLLAHSLRASSSGRSPATLRPHLRPYPNLPRTLQPAQFSRRYAHAIPKPSRPTPPASSPSEEIKQRKLQEPHYELTFTCVPCGGRSTHTVSKQGYHKGSVLITCPSCRNRHIISDHLDIFGDRKITVEDLMRERGQLVKRGTLGEDGDIEFWEDGTVTERNKDMGNQGRSTSQQSSDPNPAASGPLTHSRKRPQIGDTASSAATTTPSNRREFSTSGLHHQNNWSVREPITRDPRALNIQPGGSDRNLGRGIPQEGSGIPNSNSRSGVSAAQSLALLRRSLTPVNGEAPILRTYRPAPPIYVTKHLDLSKEEVRKRKFSQANGPASPSYTTKHLDLSNKEDVWKRKFSQAKDLRGETRLGLGQPELTIQWEAEPSKMKKKRMKKEAKLIKKEARRKKRQEKHIARRAKREQVKLRKYMAQTRIAEAERELYGQPEARQVRQREVGVIEAEERKARERQGRILMAQQPRFTLRKYSAHSDIPGYIVRGITRDSQSSDQGREAEGPSRPVAALEISPDDRETQGSCTPSGTTPANEPETVSTKPSNRPKQKPRRRETTSFVYAWPSGATEPIRIAISRPRKSDPNAQLATTRDG